jgi:hypothetical protein
MEEEDDDLYGTGTANGNGEAQQANGQAGGEEKGDEELESGEEEEEEDSESVCHEILFLRRTRIANA